MKKINNKNNKGAFNCNAKSENNNNTINNILLKKYIVTINNLYTYDDIELDKMIKHIKKATKCDYPISQIKNICKNEIKNFDCDNFEEDINLKDARILTLFNKLINKIKHDFEYPYIYVDYICEYSKQLDRYNLTSKDISNADVEIAERNTIYDLVVDKNNIPFFIESNNERPYYLALTECQRFIWVNPRDNCKFSIFSDKDKTMLFVYRLKSIIESHNLYGKPVGVSFSTLKVVYQNVFNQDSVSAIKINHLINKINASQMESDIHETFNKYRRLYKDIRGYVHSVDKSNIFYDEIINFNEEIMEFEVINSTQWMM